MAGKRTHNEEDMRVDHLKVDPVVPGQDWAVVSFVNPEDMVVKKFLHYTNNFMVSDINKTLTASATQMVKLLKSTMRNRIEDLLDKLNNSRDPDDKHMGQLLEKRYRDMDIDEDQFVDECRRRYELDDAEIMDRYKMYVTEHRQRMDTDFDNANDDATSVRGFKIRGSYKRLADAKDRCMFVRAEVEEGIHAFVVPVGTWFPIDVEADDVQDQEYMLPELNKMMGKYHESIHARNQHYKERKTEMKEQAENASKMDTKERMRATLRAKREAKMKMEIEEQQKLMMGTVNTTPQETAATVTASPKKKNKKSKNAASAVVTDAPA